MRDFDAKASQEKDRVRVNERANEQGLSRAFSDFATHSNQQNDMSIDRRSTFLSTPDCYYDEREEEKRIGAILNDAVCLDHKKVCCTE